MTFFLVPGQDETKAHNLFVDTADSTVYSFFLLACPIRQQELQVSLIFHIFNKRHAKHETLVFLEGSEILSVVKLKATAASGTCVMRVLATPAGLWIPSGPIMLVCLAS